MLYRYPTTAPPLQRFRQWWKIKQSLSAARVRSDTGSYFLLSKRTTLLWIFLRVKFYPDDRIYWVFFLVLPQFCNEQTKVYFGGNIYNLSEINSVRKRGKRAVLGTLNLDNIKNTTTGIALSYYFTTSLLLDTAGKYKITSDTRVQDFILGQFKTAFTEYIFGQLNSGKNLCSELLLFSTV